MAQRQSAAMTEDAIKANPRCHQTMYDNMVIDSPPAGAFKQGMSQAHVPSLCELHYATYVCVCSRFINTTPNELITYEEKH